MIRAALSLSLVLGGCGGAPPTQRASANMIAVVPLTFVVDKNVAVKTVELHQDGRITMDGAQRAIVDGATIHGDAGEIIADASGRVTVRDARAPAGGNAPKLLAFAANDDLLALGDDGSATKSGIHVDDDGKVWNTDRTQYAASDGHFVSLPKGAHRTAALLVVALMVFTPVPLEDGAK